MTSRRRVLAAVGEGGTLCARTEAVCEALGRAAIEAGFRVVTGGRAGAMAAVSRGARSSPRWREGDIIGVLPGYDGTDANEWVDVVVPTGLGIARNVVVVAMADVVVAVGGGAGTLSECAIAWQLGKPIVALADEGGWAARLAGTAVDTRPRPPVLRAASVDEAVAIAQRVADPDDVGGILGPL